ncbi:MAG TPA: hypothetical protein VNJ01_15405 [Bacteriovoracaceae bacterium]|nr:hypothetical protein [Bacteriovoracaceae bacterium]
MKYVISLMLAVSAQAAPINVYFEAGPSDPRMIKQILMQDYSIPEDLIDEKEVRSCGEIQKKSKLDLCLKNNGDLLLVSVDRGFVNESLKIFKAP